MYGPPAQKIVHLDGSIRPARGRTTPDAELDFIQEVRLTGGLPADMAALPEDIVNAITSGGQ